MISPGSSACTVAPEGKEAGAVPMVDAGYERAIDLHALVATMDRTGRLISVNDNFCSFIGYSREELLGGRHHLVDPEVNPRELLRDVWRTLNRGKVWQGEIREVAKDGTMYWAATTIMPSLEDQGETREFVIVQSDITAKKQVESDLAESLRLQQLLAELSSRFVSAASSQVDHTIEETQRLIGETLHLDSSTLWQVAQDGDGLMLTHSWLHPDCHLLPSMFSAVGRLPWAFAKIMRGEWFAFSKLEDLPPMAAQDVEVLKAFGLKSKIVFPLVANGHTYGALAFATLREERIWRPEELIELRLVAQIISNVLRRQRAEIREEELRAELAHAMRISSLGELAAALTHELNQPLAAILSNAQAALRFSDDGVLSSDELRPILQDIVRDNKRAGNVIHNLRMMVSKRTGDREHCSLNEIVHEVMELLRSELITERIELRTTLAPKLPLALAIRVEMQQIMVNFVMNAVHAMKNTPDDYRTIDIETTAEPGFVTLRVKDRGHGIPPERQVNIFDPFVSTKADGLGMGLSICRRIIENHEGKIEAHNLAGGGACFSFSLRRQDELPG